MPLIFHSTFLCYDHSKTQAASRRKQGHKS